jgi:hypothetical protein
MNMTALHYACLHGHADTVEALCHLGASVILVDDRNRTCIEIAAYHALGPKYPKVRLFFFFSRVFLDIEDDLFSSKSWVVFLF